MLKKNNSFYLILNFCFLFVIFFLFVSIASAEKIDPAYELAVTKAVNKIENADYEGAITDLKDMA